MFLDLGCLPKPTSSDTGNISLKAASFHCAGASAFPPGGIPFLQVWGMGTARRQSAAGTTQIPGADRGLCCSQPQARCRTPAQGCSPADKSRGRSEVTQLRSLAVLSHLGQLCSTHRRAARSFHITNIFFPAPSYFWGAQGVQIEARCSQQMANIKTGAA